MIKWIKARAIETMSMVFITSGIAGLFWLFCISI